jgi:serine/threonine protein kinase
MAAQTNAPLPVGTEIGGYRILKKISSGGFSIVYLAEDRAGERFAIKEYLPSMLVLRREGEQAPAISPQHHSTYRNGLKCFFEEGRSLARILHPNVVRVVNFFRDNDTVYMVMAYETGRSLQEIVLRNRNRPDGVVIGERHIRRVFLQVMNGLREVHANRMLHLDIKPANVYLRADGVPMLLDFGAARQTLSADAPKLFPMYTPGFAAPELYRKNVQLGPWTDIYSLGATLFACMMGAPPQAADQRQIGDRVPALLDKLGERYSRQLVDTTAWCLKIDPLERPQSVFALQRAMRAVRWHDSRLPRTQLGGVAGWLDSMFTRFGRQREADTTLTMLS